MLQRNVMVLVLAISLLIPFQSIDGTVKQYSTVLYCPIDTIDLTDVYLELDYMRLCEVEGNVLYSDSSNSNEFENLLQEELEDLVEVDKPLVKEQLDSIYEEIKNDLISQLTKALEEYYELNLNVDDLKNKIQIILNKLKAKLANTTPEEAIENILTQEELDRIIAEMMAGRFILMAYAQEDNIYKVKDKMNDLSGLFEQYSTQIEENDKVQEQYNNLVLIYDMLTMNLAKSEELLKDFGSDLINDAEDLFDWLRNH